jgi:hypothetical protein
VHRVHAQPAIWNSSFARCLSCRIGGVSPGDTALVVILSGLGCLAMGAGLSVLIMRASVRKQQKREKERAQVMQAEAANAKA